MTIFTGTNSDDILFAPDGGDHVFFGLDGSDILQGAGGNDVFDGGGDDDLIVGNGGIDTASYASATSAVTVDLTFSGVFQDTGGAGNDSLDGIQNLIGSDFNDTLTGDGNANVMGGGLGNDVLDGGDGDDTLAGGLGDDSITGGAGIDTASYVGSASAVTVSLAIAGAQATGGAGTDTLTGIENLTGSLFNDVLTGDDGDNIINGGVTGRDILSGRGGVNTLNGGANIDTASYAFAASGVTVSLAVAGAQATGVSTDTLIGIESLTGSDFDDTLTGNAGLNEIYGEGGADLIVGGAGNDILDGGAGIDTVDYSGNSAIRLNLAISAAQSVGTTAGRDAVRNFENVTGTDFGDMLTGNSASNRILGGDGDDVIAGGGGDDFLDGGMGIDTVSYAAATQGVVALVGISAIDDALGGFDALNGFENVTGSAFNDTLTGDGGDNRLLGGAGDDMLTGGLGDDFMDGGTGVDTISFADNATSVYIDLNLTTTQDTGAGYDAIRAVENVVGTDYEDFLTGNFADNVLSGGLGADFIDGGGRNDTLNGGGDDDLLFGGGGNDIINGGDDDDILIGGNGNDVLDGGAGNDIAYYITSTAKVQVDLAITTSQNTRGQGFDTLTSIEGLYGSAYDDTLAGDAGDNLIMGSFGSDVLTGRAGADIFVYETEFDSTVCGCYGTDLITDFTSGDILDISVIDADYNTLDDDAFVLVAELTGVAGQATLTYDAIHNQTVLATDTDGDGFGDFGIVFTGDVTGMTGTWLL